MKNDKAPIAAILLKSLTEYENENIVAQFVEIIIRYTIHNMYITILGLFPVKSRYVTIIPVIAEIVVETQKPGFMYLNFFSLIIEAKA